MSAEVEQEPKLNNAPKKEVDKRKQAHPQHKKHKHEENRHFKHGRKRTQNFCGNGKFCPPYKRRKKGDEIIPPTKFLLGGNICDPLNLNSMQDEEINRAMNAVTPKSSPLPTPKHRRGRIEVIIPPNISDPLNLCSMKDEEHERLLLNSNSPVKKKRNKKRRRNSSSGSSIKDTTTLDTLNKDKTDCSKFDDCQKLLRLVNEEYYKPIEADPAHKDGDPFVCPPTKEDATSKTKKSKPLDEVKRFNKDKIVSPAIPQPGAWKGRVPPWNNQEKKNLKKINQQQLPKFNPKNDRFKFGNYNRYYGYRNPNHMADLRLTALAQRKELFRGKDVLDIGCNTGQVGLAIASDFKVRSMVGIDIDGKLIKIARKNIQHYVNRRESPRNDDPEHEEECFPISMPINYGPIAIPGFTKQNNHKGFPYNVSFVQGNYVLDDDTLLSSEQPQFDTILCLSTTKWIHLNFGDAGLKQAFKRMHAQLRPGGVLILEAQNWSGYGKRKRLTESIYKNYHSIELYPNKFTQYLLSSEVGFRKCEVLSVACHPSKGFQRPIHLYTKADNSKKSPVLEPVAKQVEAPPIVKRRAHEVEERLAEERRNYERDLFPDVNRDFGKTSQRSNESLSQWDHLANVYAPSATPCYDTPSHNCSGTTPEPEKTYHVDVVNSNTPRTDVTPEDKADRGYASVSRKVYARIDVPAWGTPKSDVTSKNDATPKSDEMPVDSGDPKTNANTSLFSGEARTSETELQSSPPSGELQDT